MGTIFPRILSLSHHPLLPWDTLFISKQALVAGKCSFPFVHFFVCLPCSLECNNPDSVRWNLPWSLMSEIIPKKSICWMQRRVSVCACVYEAVFCKIVFSVFGAWLNSMCVVVGFFVNRTNCLCTKWPGYGGFEQKKLPMMNV